MIPNDQLIKGMKIDGNCVYYTGSEELSHKDHMRGYILKSLEEHPNEVFNWIKGRKWMRRQAESSLYPPGQPIQWIPNNDAFGNSIGEFAIEIQRYVNTTKYDVDVSANNFSLTRLVDDERFEATYTKSLQMNALLVEEEPDYLNIEGFVSRERIMSEDPNAPVIYIRSSIATNLNRYHEVRTHESAHAFSMAFPNPEKFFGYSLEDDGEVEMLVRHHIVEERIASLESGSPLEDLYFPPIFVCGDENSPKRYEELAEKNRRAIGDARSIMRDPTDLAHLLKVVPVQMMEKTLPNLVNAYCEAGYNNLVGGSIPEADPPTP